MARTLREVLEESNIQTFESSNGRRVANCPFHEGDRSPSFTLYPNETYYCFGCKVWGNPVKFLVDYKGMTAQAAMDYVGVDYHIPTAHKRVIKIKNTLMTGVFLMDIARQYHEHLLRTPGPMKYLTDRGLNLGTIQRHFLGYSDGSVLDLNTVEDVELAESVGLLNKGGYDALSHRIVIPNIIDNQYCDFMTGRTVINDKNKYLGLRVPKPIMGFHQYRHSPILFMVEGQFDWLLLKQWGYPAVVTSGSHMKKNMSLLKGKYIVYIPDNDEAGRLASEEIVNIFGPHYTAILDISNISHKDLSEWTQYDPQAELKFLSIAEEALCDILSLNPTWMKFVPQLSLQMLSDLT